VPFDLPADRFVFLFVFDYFSTVERKNPVGLIEAFQRAFEPDEGPWLMLKTINAEFRPEARERLRHAIGGRDDILLVDATIEETELAALYERADCYVSMHRAEGYGLTLAQAMVLGKPVIATDWSGNTDFMTPSNAYLVDYELGPVGPDAEHYPQEGVWAIPSVEHAAELMREVVADPEAARARGARAQADVQATLSPEAVGGVARARLERIARTGSRSEWQAATPPYPLDKLAHRVHFPLDGSGRAGIRGLARRLMMRTIRPYTMSERLLDETVASSLQRLHAEVAAERAARERDRHRIAMLERRLSELGE
jgi:hypothetical protein